MLADKEAIAKLIPHTGSMCLLDGVVQYDAQQIRCVSRSHRDLDNPMRSGECLHALCGIEYAAQAMAVHGGMTGEVGARPRAGYLAAVRDVQCHVSRLDQLESELIIEAEKLMGDDTRVMYQFTLRSGEIEVMRGKATAVLDVDRVIV